MSIMAGNVCIFLLVQINWNVYNKEQKIQERKAIEENYGSIWGKGMEKDVLIVLGNGFSIDFVNFIQKNEIINLTNLFCNGDKVLWPADNYPGFLSKYRCPALWELGARPNSDAVQSGKIIEDIITCANVSASSEHPAINSENTNVYIRAYHELVIYLKYLFIYYNRLISDKDFDKVIVEKWGWAEMIKNLSQSSEVHSVTIITYNYDIILERLLTRMKIDFQMTGFDIENQKFSIIKPHGSIGFRSRKVYDKESFSIKYNRDSLGGSLEDLVFDLNAGYEKISNINTMIPPAGESGRYKLFWSKILKEKAVEAAYKLQEDDDVIYGGISYCNVDRAEIDEQIICLNSDVNFRIINPDAQNTFCAVISSLFKQYIHYTQSEVLGGLYK